MRSEHYIKQLRQIPRPFEPDLYRHATELHYLSDEEAWRHWKEWGREKGIHGCSLTDRNDFAALALIGHEITDVLEISPFTSPLVLGATTCDVYSTEQLRRRAPELDLNPEDVVEVDFVLSLDSGLRSIPRKFANVISSHSVEHIPDLIEHFDEVASLLDEGGRYFVLLPDYRFCFDHFIPPSGLADILAAHLERRKKHSTTSFLEQRLLTTHNDSARHWTGDFGNFSFELDTRVQGVIDEWNALSGEYIDLHAWQFDPQTFEELVPICLAAFNIPLKVEAVYHTRLNSNEFWAVLRKN